MHFGTRMLSATKAIRNMAKQANLEHSESADTRANLPKRLIFVVNEPGEFKELLKLAKLLTKKGATRCTFLFCRPDYVAYNSHADICKNFGFFSVHVNPHYSAQEIEFYLGEQFQDDYIPTFFQQQSLKTRKKALTKNPKVSKSSFQKMKWQLYRKVLFVPALCLRVTGLGVRTLGAVQSMRAVDTHVRSYKAMKQYFYNLCEWERPDMVLFGQDYAGSFNAAASYVARELLKLPVITVPFAMGTTKEINEALFYYPAHRANSNKFTRRVAKLLPKWVNVYKGHSMLRLPAEQAVAAELEDATAPFPWLPYSGHTYFLASSQQAYDYYISAGMDPDKVFVTGSFNDNIWARGKKEDETAKFAQRKLEQQKHKNLIRMQAERRIGNAIGSKLDAEISKPDAKGEHISGDFLSDLITNPIDQRELRRRQLVASGALANMIWQKENKHNDEQKLVVVSWPTNQFSRPAPDLEFEDYEAVSYFWANALRDIADEFGALVMVSLHPTLLNQNFDYLEEDFGFKIWHGALTDILPKADLFVSCVSSTLFWAVNLGVPSINYDCYGYGYREFDETGAIKTVSRRSDFTELLDRVFADKNVYKDMKNSAVNNGNYWGFDDGGSDDRILEAIANIMSQHSSS